MKKNIFKKEKSLSDIISSSSISKDEILYVNKLNDYLIVLNNIQKDCLKALNDIVSKYDTL